MRIHTRPHARTRTRSSISQERLKGPALLPHALVRENRLGQSPSYIFLEEKSLFSIVCNVLDSD